MDYLVVVVTAMVISIIIIAMIGRVAPTLGLMDLPNNRNIHFKPMPRVGGLGIFPGALLPVLLMVNDDPLLQSYLLGASVLFVFGVWDDRCQIGHYKKFAGQAIAALIVVMYGGLYVTSFPLFSDMELPRVIAIPFTICAIIGLTNAVNHSDGLDGLAGGESLISLGAIALLAYLAGDQVAVIVALAVIGGIYGFLRFNTYPAGVYMGDAGSQFLGFTLAFLLIYLTQRVDPGLSPAVVGMLAGLPIADILMVFAKRIRERKHWFLATKNHLHHRLLALGFGHGKSVTIIYSLQMFFVATGLLLRHEPDWLIIVSYLGTCSLIFGLLSVAEQKGWRADRSDPGGQAFTPIASRAVRRLLVVAPRRFLSVGVSGFLIANSFFVQSVPHDFGVIAAVAFGLMLFVLIDGKDRRSILGRALIHVTAGSVVYLAIVYPPSWGLWGELVDTMFFVLVGVGMLIAIYFSPGRRSVEFNVTPMDYLVALAVVATLIVTTGQSGSDFAVALIVHIVIILYACELLTIERVERWNTLGAATMVSALVLALRGLV